MSTPHFSVSTSPQNTDSVSEAEKKLHAIGSHNPLVPQKVKENPQLLDKLIGSTVQLNKLKQQAAQTLQKLTAVCISQRLELLLEQEQPHVSAKAWRQALLELNHFKPLLYKEPDLALFFQNVLTHKNLQGKKRHISFSRYDDALSAPASALFLKIVENIHQTLVTAEQQYLEQYAKDALEQKPASFSGSEEVALFSQVYAPETVGSAPKKATP